MSVAEGSRERVEERLVALEEGHSGFPVNQTTLSVSSDAYERASERCRDGIVDAYVQVYNDREHVLLVERDGEWVVPHCEPATSERVVEGTERALRERTGVDCVVTGLSRVTILGVRDADDPDRQPVYRLIAVFTAETDREPPGTVADGDPVVDEQLAAEAEPSAVRWQAVLPDSAIPSH